MPGRMQGHPWHIGYVKAKDGRRHKARCVHYGLKNTCPIYGRCIGSSHCDKYSEKIEKKLDAKKHPNTDERYQDKSKKTVHKKRGRQSNKAKFKGIKVGDTVELLDPIDNFKMKVHIVNKGKACLDENKISEESPIGKAVLGKRKGERVEIFTNRKVVYEIIGWEKRG